MILLLSYIERFHIHDNKNSHKNNPGYSVKSAILLYKFQCASYDKKCKTAYLIEV